MAGFDNHDIRFRFQIIDQKDGDVLADDYTYILVNDETFEVSIDSVETHVYSALRHLPEALRRKAQEEAEAREEAARLEAEDRAEFGESVLAIRSKISKILREGEDWYERRNELKVGDDWSNDEATIEPGDLKEKIKDPKKA